jgi:hypothetical protein
LVCCSRSWLARASPACSVAKRLLAAGLALAAFVAAALFTGEARGSEEQLAQLKTQREQAALDERLLVPVAAVADVDATLIGVDKAVQAILPGGALPRYVAREVDEALRAAFAAALDGRGRWIVVAVGLSKAGKSRALFEALEHRTRGKAVDLVAPRDGDALRSMLIPGQAPVQRAAVLWLDDIEPFLGDSVTVHTLRSRRDAFPGSVVAATLGGKGAGRVSTSSAPAVSVLGDAVLMNYARSAGVDCGTDDQQPTAGHEEKGDPHAGDQVARTSEARERPHNVTGTAEHSSTLAFWQVSSAAATREPSRPRMGSMQAAR